jgi:antitoxin component YwqK of YwqJK toxin-antitoxin module
MIFFSSFLNGFGQQYKYIYYLDENLNAVEKPKSILTGKAYYENGALKMDCFGKTTEKLLLTATFTDSALNELQGLFRTYHNNMSTESEGNYTKNVKQGLWQEWDKKGQKTDSLIYENGIRIVKAKFYYNKNGGLSSFEVTDSLQNTMSGKGFSDNGLLNYEKNFVGEMGILKHYDSSGVRIDSVFTREEIEASFPGGDKAWRNYLEKNLNTEVPGNNRAPAGIYKVIIKFVVNKEGVITNVIAENAPGYGTEKEAIRIITKSPRWIPAKQYGRFVNAYRRQPISFSVEYGR